MKATKNETRLLRAIKRLGNTPEEIRLNLIERGFQAFNQSDPQACPVCAYLISIGFKRPKVTMHRVVVGKNKTIVINLSPKAEAMVRFQEHAAYGMYPGLGGFRG